MATATQRKYDLLVVTDATASMGSFLDALRGSISEILELSRLSGVFSRLGVIAYYDYCDNPVIAKSGWNSPDLQKFVQSLSPTGGGDFPEAAKTALIEALDAADDSENTETLVIWYTDAPPHHSTFGGSNYTAERGAYPGRTDWVDLTAEAQRKHFTVFVIATTMVDLHRSFFVYLTQMTGGLNISQAATHASSTISQLTLDVILHWMGQNGAPMSESEHSTCQRFELSPQNCLPPPSDEDSGSMQYLPSNATLKTIVSLPLSAEYILRGSVVSSLSLTSLGKRFADPTESAYRAQVYEGLSNIIGSNIMALTRNPVFGQLWRAVCKDSENPNLAGLLNAFSTKVAQIADPAEKATLQKWLDDSFDATEAIMAMVAKVPAEGPIVYLDFDADVEMSRSDLLEVSKSCYSAVLKKVASIFTHLKIKEATSDVVLTSTQRYLPLNSDPRQLFRTLPHLVVPGTLYPPRAAAITAIIALVTGVPFLHDAAVAVLTQEKGSWLDIEVPENLSFECGKLLLSAPEGIVLSDDERKVYSAMRHYRFVELNLDSTLKATLPWTPEKTRGVGDFMRDCATCHRHRSITLMSDETSGVCGLCSYEKDFPEHDETTSCWVECHEKTCRAHYVVEFPNDLRIRPKCHYCRNSLACPWLECTTCTNRVIVPQPCREGMDVASFQCPACAHPEKNIQVLRSQEITSRALVEENGLGWLGYTSADAREKLFQGRSAFKMIQAHGFGVFDFDDQEKHEIALTLNGKKVQNCGDVRAQVDHRANRGDVELGRCALCFEDKPRSLLPAACGRSGCIYRADEECLKAWYGKSEPGRLVNLMQLSCPFCRRRPAFKVLNKYNSRATTLGGLREALDDHHYFYAWCMQCGFAKQAQERACCGEDWTPNIENFRCEDCRTAAGGVHLGAGSVRITACPQCGVAVEKISGCNHIECQCGTHFCHVCGGGFEADKIYVHMADEHGGMYDNDEVYGEVGDGGY